MGRFLAVLCVLCLTACCGYANDQNNPYADQEGQIQRLVQDSQNQQRWQLTVTDKDGANKVMFTLDDSTKIMLNNKEVSFNDIKQSLQNKESLYCKVQTKDNDSKFASRIIARTQQ